MRRRLNLEFLADQILIVLQDKFFDDKISFVSFADLRDALEKSPANAIRMELDELVSRHFVAQKRETRTRSNFFPVAGQDPTYEVAVDGYRLSKSGIARVEQFDDDHYNLLRAALEIETALPGNETVPWTPLPLERNDEELKTATEALEKTVAQLRADNGYAATNASEKAYVQDKLTAVTKRLKEDAEISWIYLRDFALEPLAILIRRFGKAAIGISATAARDAIVTWLKTKGIALLTDLFK